MIVAITGGRDHHPSPRELREFLALFNALDGTALVHGDARGVDRIAAAALRTDQVKRYGEVRVEIVAYTVRNDLDGPWPAAGHRRNARMLRESGAEVVVAFKGGSGTAGCVKEAERLGLMVFRIETRSSK